MKTLKNTLMLNIGQVLSILLALIYQILLFKTFDPDTAGKILAYSSLVNVLSVICCFGLSNYFIANYAETYSEIGKEKKNIMVHIFVTIFISLFIMSVYTFINKDSPLYITAFFPMFICISFSAILISFYQLQRKFFLLVIVSLLVPLVKPVTILWSMTSEIDTINKFLLSNLLLFLLMSLIFLKKIDLKLIEKNSDETKYMEFYKTVFPYGLNNLTFLFYTNIVVLVLSLYDMNKQVAFLSISLLLYNCILMIPTVIIQKIYATKIYIYIESNITLAYKLMRRLRVYLLIYSVFAIVATLIIGNEIITLIFPSIHQSVFHTLTILLIALPFRTLNLVDGVFLSSKYYINYKMKVEIFINVLLCMGVIFIIRYYDFEKVLFYIIFIDLFWFISNWIIVSILGRRTKWRQ